EVARELRGDVSVMDKISVTPLRPQEKRRLDEEPDCSEHRRQQPWARATSRVGSGSAGRSAGIAWTCCWRTGKHFGSRCGIRQDGQANQTTLPEAKPGEGQRDQGQAQRQVAHRTQRPGRGSPLWAS